MDSQRITHKVLKEKPVVQKELKDVSFVNLLSLNERFATVLIIVDGV